MRGHQEDSNYFKRWGDRSEEYFLCLNSSKPTFFTKLEKIIFPLPRLCWLAWTTLNSLKGHQLFFNCELRGLQVKARFLHKGGDDIFVAFHLRAIIFCTDFRNHHLMITSSIFLCLQSLLPRWNFPLRASIEVLGVNR